MTNEWIMGQLKTAKEVLDRVPELGEAAFNLCDGILSNLKTFVTDEKIWVTITTFEEKLYKDFKKKESEARAKLKDIDSLVQFNSGQEYYINLRKWKSTELLSLWNRLSKDYDL
jgi:RecA-family ATPase